MNHDKSMIKSKKFINLNLDMLHIFRQNVIINLVLYFKIVAVRLTCLSNFMLF